MAKTIEVTIAHAGGKLVIVNGDSQSSYCDSAVFEYRGRRIAIKGGRMQTVKRRAEEIRTGLDVEISKLDAWNKGTQA